MTAAEQLKGSPRRAIDKDDGPRSSLLDDVGAVVCVLAPDGRLTRINRAGERLSGRDQSEMIGQPLWTVLLAADGVDAFRTVFNDLIADRKTSAVMESHWQTAAGERRLMACSFAMHTGSDGQIDNVIVTAVDITSLRQQDDHDRTRRLEQLNHRLNLEVEERQRVEAALRAAYDELEHRVATRTTELQTVNNQLKEREERNRALLAAIPDLMFLLDRQGTYLDYHAENTEELYTLPSEFLGRTVREVLPTPVADETMADIEQVLTGAHQKITDYSLVINGETRHYERRLVKCGEDRVLSIVRNITERIEAVEREREHQAELAHVTRMGTMGEMAAGITHELSQPLTAIASYAAAGLNAARENPPAADNVVGPLAAIREQSTYAMEIIRHLRKLARKQSPQRELVEPGVLVRNVFGLVHSELLEAGAVADFHLDKVDAVFVDPVQMEQVLLNVVRNAIDAPYGRPGAEREG